MNNLAKILLGGVAVSALAAAPAMAYPKHPAMHVTAMRAGHAVNKTRLHNQGASAIDYTMGVYTYQSASAPAKTPLAGTFYKWNSNNTLCSAPKQKIKAPKKSIYAKIGTTAEAYSIGCPSGPTTFYGDLWTNKTGVSGNTDAFSSVLSGKFKNGSNKYKGSLALNVWVIIQ